MTRAIRIAVADSDAPPGQINIRFSNVQERRETVVQIPLPNDFLSEEIRWYLEDFAQHNPSERERAKDVEAALTHHGKELGFFIHCSKVLETGGPSKIGPMLLIEIEDLPQMPPSILWEALERKSALDSFPNVDSAIVTRVFTTGPLGNGLRDIAFLDYKDEPSNLNILIVSARADLEADISHRLVAHQALAALNVMSTDIPPLKDFTHVEVLHPATFDAFQAHLEVRKPGYFNLVHLDLHGCKDESGK